MNTAADQWPKRHLITVDEYYRMAEVGLLAPDARVELIQGEVIDMAPIGSRHAAIVSSLSALLIRSVGERAVVWIQSPVRLDTRSEPQPDVALLKPRSDGYRDAYPTPQDVLLLIEVSDTLRFDRGPKLALYAVHEIPEVWIVDVEGRQLHCLREPSAGDYGTSLILQPSEAVNAAALPDVKLELAALFD
jgi:Uma2 family endonuclease